MGTYDVSHIRQIAVASVDWVSIYNTMYSLYVQFVDPLVMCDEYMLTYLRPSLSLSLAHMIIDLNADMLTRLVSGYTVMRRHIVITRFFLLSLRSWIYKLNLRHIADVSELRIDQRLLIMMRRC